MAIYRIEDRIPTVDPSAYVTDSAQVMGTVRLEAHCSIWFNAVLRGDNDEITVGEGSNVQDGSVLHTDPGHKLTIGRWVTIGHQVMLHGCEIGDESLIGIQSVILNGSRIGRNCLIGAGSVIAEGKTIPDRSLVIGAPGRVVRTLTDEEVARLRPIAAGYQRRAVQFRQHLIKIA